MTTLEELQKCANATAATPETEAEDTLAHGTLRLLDAVDAIEKLADDMAQQPPQELAPVRGMADIFLGTLRAVLERTP